MKPVTFIDGVSQVHFVNGLVRLDTFVLQGQQDAAPIPNENAQIVMTPQGFISALNAMQFIADKLTEAGVLQKQQPEQTEQK